VAVTWCHHPYVSTISQGISRIIYQHPHVPRLSHRGLETIAGVRGQDLVRAACGRVCGGLAATVAIGLSSYGGHRVTRGDGEMATWWWHLPDPSPYTPRKPKKALEDFFRGAARARRGSAHEFWVAFLLDSKEETPEKISRGLSGGPEKSRGDPFKDPDKVL